MLNEHDIQDYALTSPNQPERKPDMVNSPPHYLLFPEYGVEVRDVAKALADKVLKSKYNLPKDSLFMSDYVQMMYYGMRFMDKNGLEDLKKMRWYLDKVIGAYE
jgi:hypothetical protein